MAKAYETDGNTYDLGTDGDEILLLLDSLLKKDESESEDHGNAERNRIIENGYLWDTGSDKPLEAYLMIGNGFDLECGLPTSYSDFLNFINAIEHISSGKDLDGVVLNPMIKEKLRDKVPDISLWQPLLHNYWYRHFKKARIRLGWVDFENEIAKVIRSVEKSTELTRFRPATMDDYVSGMMKSDLTNTIGDLLKEYGIKSKQRIKNSGKYIEYDLLYRELRDRLLNDLDQFICGLEGYLREFVEPMRILITKSVLELLKKISRCEYRYIINFNYTTTLEKLLNSVGIKANFCYVHGRIGDGKSKNKMVLGIDEYLISNGVKSLIDFAPFRKYNQRIYKETDSCYFDWMDHIKSINHSRILYIFGHSLGITDKDIIEPFLLGNIMNAEIYYHDEDSFSDKVGNLTAIIGMEEMIKRTGGYYRTMRFVKQVK